MTPVAENVFLTSRRRNDEMKWFFESGKIYAERRLSAVASKAASNAGATKYFPPQLFRKLGRKVVEVKKLIDKIGNF